MFEAVTEDEKRHLQMVTGIIKGLHITVKDVSPIITIRTVFEEMKSEMMQKIEATADELEAFNVAMTMEKELLEHLIREEEMHYSIFMNTYQHLKDTGNWFMWEEQAIVDGGTPWA